LGFFLTPKKYGPQGRTKRCLRRASVHRRSPCPPSVLYAVIQLVFPCQFSILMVKYSNSMMSPGTSLARLRSSVSPLRFTMPSATTAWAWAPFSTHPAALRSWMSWMYSSPSRKEKVMFFFAIIKFVFQQTFSRLSIVQTLRDLPSAFGLTKTFVR